MEKGKPDLVEQARQLRLQAEELERKVNLARGTKSDVRGDGHVVVKTAPSRYHVGDEGPTEELMRAVHLALSDKPMRFTELLAATGARDNRIKGVIMRLQREGVRVVNLGTESKALWFIPDDAVMTRIMRVKRATAAR